MAQSPNDIPDIDQGLQNLTRETTAGDLVRKQGQNKKLRTIKERDLKEWIMKELRRQMAGTEDSFTDEQKEEMVAQVQRNMEIKLTEVQEQAKAAEKREREWQNQYQEAMAAAGENQQMQEHLGTLQQQVAEERAKREEAEAELLEMEDRFTENGQLLRTTISEKDRLSADKDRLQDTNRQLLMRSSSLVESALQLDNEHYRGRHQVAGEESAGEAEDAFFHDFEVGQQVLDSLNNDLERLHTTVDTKTAAAPADDLLVETVEMSEEERLADQQEEQEASRSLEEAIVRVAQLGTPSTENAIGETHLVTLYEASDQAMERLSGMIDVEDLAEVEDDSEGGPLIDDEPVAKLHRKIMLLGRGIGMQQDQLASLNEENAQLREDLEAASQNDGRQLAEMLAAAAVPLQSGEDSEEDSKLREQASSLEQLLSEEDSAGDQISDAGSAVLATMVAERRAIGDKLKEERDRAEAAEKALRQLAGVAAAAGAPEGENDEDDLNEAVVNLRRDLDASPELNPEGAQGILNDLSVDGAQVITQLVDDRKNAERRAESAINTERRLAEGLVALCEDNEDEEVQAAAASLKSALEQEDVPEGEDPVLEATAEVIAALSAQGDQVSSEALQAVEAEREAIKGELSEAHKQLNELTASHQSLATALAEFAEDQEEQAVSLSGPEHAETDNATAELSEAKHTVQKAIQEPHQQAEVAAAAQGLVQRLRTHNGGLSSQLQAQQDEIAALHDQLRNLRHSTEVHQGENDGLIQKNAELTAQLATANGEAERIGTQLGSITSELEEAQAALAENQERLGQSEEQSLVDRTKIGELESEKEQIADSLVESELKLEELHAEVAGLREQAGRLETTQAALVEQESAVEALTQKVQATETELRDSAEALETERQRVSSLQEQVETLQGQEVSHSAALTDSADKLGKVERELAQLHTEYEQQDAISVKLNEKNEELESKLAEAHEETQRLLGQTTQSEEELDAARDRITELNASLQVANKDAEESKEKVTEYEEKLGEAADTLLEKEEELSTVQARVDEMEGEIAMLRRGKDGLETSLSQAADEKIEIEKRLAEANDNIAMQDKITQNLQEQNDEWSDKFDAEVAQRSEVESALQALRGEQESLLTQSQAWETDRATLSEEIQGLRSGEEASAARLAELEAEKAGVESELQDLQGRVAALEAEKTEFSERLETAADQALELEGERDSLRETSNGLQAELETAQLRLEEYDAKFAELKDLLRQARATIEEFKAREGQHEASLREEIDSLRTQLSEEEAAHAEARRLLGELGEGQEETSAGLRRRIKDAEERLTEADIQILDLQSQLDNAANGRLDVSELRSRIGDLEAKNAELEAMRNSWSGGQGRVQQLSSELETAQSQRDTLLSRIRSIEGELTSERAKNESVLGSKDRMRQDYEERLSAEKRKLDSERHQNTELKDELMKVREDNVGMKAKLRSLTDLADE